MRSETSEARVAAGRLVERRHHLRDARTGRARREAAREPQHGGGAHGRPDERCHRVQREHRGEARLREVAQLEERHHRQPRGGRTGQHDQARQPPAPIGQVVAHRGDDVGLRCRRPFVRSHRVICQYLHKCTCLQARPRARLKASLPQ
jgi:hypothetical protein